MPHSSAHMRADGRHVETHRSEAGARTARQVSPSTADRHDSQLSMRRKGAAAARLSAQIWMVHERGDAEAADQRPCELHTSPLRMFHTSPVSDGGEDGGGGWALHARGPAASANIGTTFEVRRDERCRGSCSCRQDPTDTAAEVPQVPGCSRMRPNLMRRCASNFRGR